MAYAWGSNSHGQIGVGDTDDRAVPTRVTFPSAVSPSTIASMCGGSTFGLCRTVDGALWRCGAWSNAESPSPQFLNIGGSFTVIRAGWDFAVALDAAGQVALFGLNAFGQLNDPPKTASLVACGLRHIVYSTPSGDIFCRGSNRHGQAPSASFRLPDGRPPSLLAAGAQHSMAVSADGRILYGWGDSKRGQLVDGGTGVVRVPLRLGDNERIMALECGWTFCIALTDAGRVLTWGRSDYGQTGRTAGNLPEVVLLPCRAVSIACGSEHAAALTEDGRVWNWGWNEHGNCGTGDHQNVHSPFAVTLPSRARVIGCGAGNTWAFL